MPYLRLLLFDLLLTKTNPNNLKRRPPRSGLSGR
jgi:hypothetical protein